MRNMTPKCFKMTQHGSKMASWVLLFGSCLRQDGFQPRQNPKGKSTYSILECMLAPSTSKMSQEGPKMAQDGPKMARHGPKMAQDGAKMARRWPNMAPRWLRDGSETFQDGPRCSRDGHEKLQDGLGWPQDGPTCAKMLQDGPTWLQDGLLGGRFEYLLAPRWSSESSKS